MVLQKEEIVSYMTEALHGGEFKDILKELFKEHTDNILGIISANLLISNQNFEKLSGEIKSNNTELHNELKELQRSLEYTQELLDTTVKKKDEEILELTQKIDSLEEKKIDRREIQILQTRLSEAEDRARRKNLRIGGVFEEEEESWNDCEEKVLKIFEKKLKLPGIEIERAHRTGGKKRDKARMIVLKLKSWKDKERILKEAKRLKGTNIFISEDYSKETMEIRSELWKKVKKHREDGKYAVINYKSLVVRDQKK